MKSATERYSNLNTKSIGISDPKDQKKYNSTEMKSGRLIRLTILTQRTKHITQ